MNSYRTDENPAGGHESITVATTSIGFTATTITVAQAGGWRKRATRAFCTVETAQISVTFDGTTPSSTVGHVADAGDTFTIVGEQNVENFRAIRTTATSGNIRVTFYFNR